MSTPHVSLNRDGVSVSLQLLQCWDLSRLSPMPTRIMQCTTVAFDDICSLSPEGANVFPARCSKEYTKTFPFYSAYFIPS